MPCHIVLSDFVENAEFYFTNYDIIVLPGGVKALEKLRLNKDVLNFISRWDAAGKVIVSTCHGAQLMISAKIVKDRNISGYYSLEDDINNAGATYVNAPYVIDRNIISSPHYDHMGVWMEKAIELYNTTNAKTARDLAVSQIAVVQNNANASFWWTSTLKDNKAYYRNLDSDHQSIFRYFTYKNYGFSVRCLKDSL
jgi:transcriptional regulator GlxA family with amidase domain